MMNSIAIIGGGPAGATAAEALLETANPDRGGQRKFQVTIFEERQGWEKPCGGGLTAKAARRYPFLLEACAPYTRVKEAELAASTGQAVRFELRAPLLIYSRKVLNHLLLSRAEARGAAIICDHIRGFHREGSRWRLEGRTAAYYADFVVLAAGARSPLRLSLANPLRPQDFLLTYGFYAPGYDSLLRVQFFKDFEGYAWAFPRPDHFSIGIAGRAGENRMADLRARLRRFMEDFGYSSDNAPVFSHVLPALGPQSWRNLRLAGDGWAIAGDAGGLADPLTGEGIYFAMRSGELLAESLLEGAPERYSQRVWQEFGRRHAMGSNLCPRFYQGAFMGKACTTRMVEFCARSGAFMNLLQDLFEGTQSYSGLPGRVWKTFAKGIFQMAANTARQKLLST